MICTPRLSILPLEPSDQAAIHAKNCFPEIAKFITIGIPKSIEDTQKLLDVRSADLRNKQLALEDAERENNRVREQNAKLGSDNAAFRRDNERVAAENYDLRKEVDF